MEIVRMGFDFKKFQKDLAQQKVYDTWQYVNSLREMLTYMDMSCELLDKVYVQRAINIERKRTRNNAKSSRNWEGICL